MASPNSNVKLEAVHQRFDDTGAQIRVVTIHPGQLDEPMVCSLEVYDLKNVPSYEAVSYCWGSEENMQIIKLHGADWPVTPNLYVALKALRRESEPRKMWIDALCINQNDATEKEPQISIMGNVYTSATQTVVWLGESTPTTVAGLSLISTIALVQHLMDICDLNRLSDDMLKAFVSSTATEPLWRGVLEIFQRPYWTRLWVVQEFCLSRKVLILCGLVELDYHHVAQFLRIWKQLLRVTNDLADSITDIIREVDYLLSKRISAFYVFKVNHILWNSAIPFADASLELRRNHPLLNHISSLLSFDHIFDHTCRLLCKDPRDKVYATYSLAALHPVQGCLSTIKPNYDKSPSEVYLELAWNHIKRVKNLCLLEKAGLQRRSNAFDLPTWVPDLTFDDIAADTDSPPFLLKIGETTADWALGGHKDLITPAFLCDSVKSYYDGAMSDGLGKVIEHIRPLVDFLCSERPRSSLQLAPGVTLTESLFHLLLPELEISGDTCTELVVGFCFLLGIFCCDLEHATPPGLSLDDRHLYAQYYYIWSGEFDSHGNLGSCEKLQLLRRDFPVLDARISWPTHIFTKTEILDLVERFMRESRLFWSRIKSQRFFITSKGYLGLTGNVVNVGDLVARLHGGPNPFILRGTRTSTSYQLVDYAYIHGMMNSEIEAGNAGDIRQERIILV
ncbi:Heterokaryon incompatibility protein (HET) domain containing protein [Rhypophila sp. PSN 637]